jgi:hypothetical protein
MLGRTSKLEGTNEPKREIAGKERPKGLLLLSLVCIWICHCTYVRLCIQTGRILKPTVSRTSLQSLVGRTSKLEGTNEPKREIAGKERPKGLLLLSLEIYWSYNLYMDLSLHICKVVHSNRKNP